MYNFHRLVAKFSLFGQERKISYNICASDNCAIKKLAAFAQIVQIRISLQNYSVNAKFGQLTEVSAGQDGLALENGLEQFAFVPRLIRNDSQHFEALHVRLVWQKFHVVI